MFSKKIYRFLAIALLIFACSKESEQPFELMSTIKGKINLTSEFGQPEPDQSNASVTVSDGKDNIQVFTDASGNYLIDKVKTGTYNISVEKSGFSKINFSGIGVVGGNEPYYFSTSLPRPSSIVITDFAMAYSPGQLTFTGSASTFSNYYAGIVFLSTTPDVSPEKFQRAFPLYNMNVNSKTFSVNAYVESNAFPKGTTLYAVAHGLSLLYAIYNLETDQYNYPTAGKVPSKVVSVQIP